MFYCTCNLKLIKYLKALESKQLKTFEFQIVGVFTNLMGEKYLNFELIESCKLSQLNSVNNIRNS